MEYEGVGVGYMPTQTYGKLIAANKYEVYGV